MYFDGLYPDELLKERGSTKSRIVKELSIMEPGTSQPAATYNEEQNHSESCQKNSATPGIRRTTEAVDINEYLSQKEYKKKALESKGKALKNNEINKLLICECGVHVCH